MVLQPNEPERQSSSETEYPSESLPDFALEAKDISPFAEAIGEFDSSQARMHDAILNIAENDINTADYIEVAAGLQDTVQAFGISAQMIMQENSGDDIRNTAIIHLIQDGETNRHKLLADIDPEVSADYKPFDRKLVQDEVELIFFNSHSDIEAQERLAQVFVSMAEYDIQTIFASISELQAKRAEAEAIQENSADDSETQPNEAHPLLKRRFGRQAMVNATIIAGSSGALFAQFLNLRFR